MKIHIKCINPEVNTIIQMKLFSLGYEWGRGQEVKYLDAYALLINTEWKGLAYHEEHEMVDDPEYKEISFDELFTMEIRCEI